MKWFLRGLTYLACSVLLAHADQAGDLYTKGTNALSQGDYATAAQALDQIITGYPTTPNIDAVRMRAGFAYLQLGDYPKAIDRLSKETTPSAPMDNKATALFYLGYAQLLQGGKLTGDSQRNAMFAQAANTMTQLLSFIKANPSPDNNGYLAEAYYNRALAEFYKEDLHAAEADVQVLVGPSFQANLRRNDYYLLLGNLYAREASEAMTAKKSADEVKPLVAKAIEAFDHVANDPNALVQANDANAAEADILYLAASLDLPDTSGYQKALDAYRKIIRKDDLVQLQQTRLDQLKAQSQSQLQGSQGATLATENSRLIDRENGRLQDLKSGPDPIIQALIRIAECYNTMKQGDEARTVIHRLAHATLTKEQQQEVDFALIYSYVLGGQTDKADKALTDYLAKHPGDPQAEGLSVQMAKSLMDRKDYAGGLSQANRSLKDFPNGKYVGEAIEMKAQALKSLGRFDEAKKVADDYLQANPRSPVAIGLFISDAQVATAHGDLNGALADYAKVKDNTSATPEIQAAGDIGYIQTLQSLGRIDDVIAESKAFTAKYPNNPDLRSVLVMQGVAMDQKHDPGAVAALQDVAKKFPQDDANSPAPFALFYVVNIYQRANNIPAMIQAANDLKKAFPAQYKLLLQAADAVSAVDVKEKKFDLAIAEYQPLADGTDPEVSAVARTKIGGIWLKAAKALGPYQSMQEDAQRAEAQKRLGSAEQAFVGVLKSSPDQLKAVDNAFQGLDDVLAQRRSWGLLKEPDFDAYLDKVTADLTDPDMKARVELAKAGLVFIIKQGEKQYPAALARFRAAITASPNLHLTRVEASQYGQLLLAAKDYTTAEQVYTALLEGDPKDQETQADGDYGLGATYLAQGDVAKAATYFAAMKKLPGGAAWHPHILQANFGLALAGEQSGQPNDLAAAKATYAGLMQASQAGVELQAKAMLGYGRILQKEGATTAPVVPGTIEYAVHYFQQVDTIFGAAVPELSAEGLYDAGQVYDKAGDKANAKKQYDTILKNYSTSAPDWAAKAQAAGGS